MLDPGIEILIVDSIHFLPVVLLTLQLVQHIPQRVSTLLVQYPCVLLVDEVVVQLDQVLDARTVGEFFLRCPSELEEVSAEPNLLYVGLVTALSYYLLYSILLLALLMLPQPHQTETSPPQQLHLVKTIWESVSEYFCLLLTQVIGVLLFLLPLQLYFLQTIILLSLLHLHLFGRSFMLSGGKGRML